MTDRPGTGRLRAARQRPPRTFAPVVDQHATWIAVNPVQGCPKACVYCFLHERGQAGVRPRHLADPAETADLLTASPYYAPGRAVALYTWTDVMALPASQAHLAELLAILADRKIPNPVVLITKCLVPDEIIEKTAAARRAGLRVIAYVSYSGLGPDIERGIRAADVRSNFPRLAAAGVPVVHYWRPALPASTAAPVMESVLDWVASRAACTMAAGLKVEAGALARLAAWWPELAATPGVADAEGVYPRPFWEFIHQAGQRHPGYPLFHANSCALAYVLAQPDRFGIFGTEACHVRSHCPQAQRQRCAADAAIRPAPSEAQVRAALDRRGHLGTSFALERDRREVLIRAELPASSIAALTQDLGVRVRAARPGSDPYWNSGTAGAVPLIIG